MLTPKRPRQITGYTHKEQFAKADLWFAKATAFYDAAAILYKAGDRLSDSVTVVSFNYAIALELSFKAILVATGNKFKPTHNLNALCKAANVEIDEDQECTLGLLTAIVYWRARYPVPNKEEEWDSYHDQVLEKHKIRTQSGNVHVTGVDLKRWPTDRNCGRLWDVCRSRYLSVSAPNTGV